jgi:2-oxo-hept-3-ene-1,7-dioate hydratase
MTKTNLTLATPEETQFANTLFQALQTQTKLDESKYQTLLQDDDAAYRVQYALTQLKQEPVRGYKVSLTSKQTQDMFDSDSPLYGAEVDHQWLSSPAQLPLSDMMEPLVEVELVFTAQEDLSATDSVDELLKKTTVAAALEVPDARFKNWFPALSKHMVMADNAVAGRVVFGKELATNTMKAADLSQVKAELTLDNQPLVAGDSSEVLGNPLNSLQWLVKKLESQGQKLKKGQRVSSGTFVLPPHLTKGHYLCHFSGDFGDVSLDVK